MAFGIKSKYFDFELSRNNLLAFNQIFRNSEFTFLFKVIELESVSNSAVSSAKGCVSKFDALDRSLWETIMAPNRDLWHTTPYCLLIRKSIVDVDNLLFVCWLILNQF